MHRKYSAFTHGLVSIALSLELAGCATTKPFATAGLVFDSSRKSTASLIKEADKNDIRNENTWAFVRGDSVDKLAAHFQPVDGMAPVAMRYCATGFSPQPTLLDGVLYDVFLSDSRIDALQNVRVEIEKAIVGNPSCIDIQGDALQLRN